MQNKTASRSTFQLLRRLAPYFKPYMGVMVLDLFCATLTTVCDLVLPLIVRYITNAATGGAAALTLSIVLRLGAAYLVLRIIDTASYYFMQSVGHIMASQMEADLRKDLFSHYQALSHDFYDHTKIGQLMSRITSDLNDITEFAHHMPEEALIVVLKVAAAFVILCQSSVLLTVIVFAALPLMVFFSNKFAKRMRRSFKDSRHELGELNARVEDSLSGIRVVKSFANEDIEKEKFAGRNAMFLKIKKGMYFNMAGFHSVTRLFDGLMYILVVILGAVFMLNGRISAPDLVAYLLYVQTLLTSIRRFVEFTEMFQRGMTGFERFDEVIHEQPTIREKEGAVELKNVTGRIEFDHVRFAYGEGLENVLSDISLNVQPGESVALVGPSGGGKTTLCSLIPRFYDVNEGSVRIDGRDVRDFTLKSLRSHIGVVQQDVYLFSGSVLENIEYGKPGATREEIIEAAKLAGAHDFICELENGYDTYVGEHGTRLSGGQKQRISIARVFLKNPPILILDEATSALDNESERIVQQSLEKLMHGRTTFTIAHRLTTIRNADEILVLTDEGIVEQGSHEALMAREHGMYRKLYQLYTN
ncbi:MAG: ABC transporter ATP-binding protein [Clostridia bacterium]|nr:ABC transporter ATP-binding protein [Clostridia bacterium]MBP3651791.1 ABC transporter ATP-binding protein [Clostridia bacterium]